MPFLTPGRFVRRWDARVRCAVARLQRALNWTQGERAKRWARWLAFVAAAPAIVSSLPLYIAVPVLLSVVAVNLLHARSGDESSLMAGLGALLRLAMLAAAALMSVLFFVAPTLIGASFAVASTLWAVEAYLHDVDL